MFFSLPAKTPEGIDNSRQYRGRKLQRNCPGDFLKNTYLGTHFVFSMLGFFRFCSFLLSSEGFPVFIFYSSRRSFSTDHQRVLHCLSTLACNSGVVES